MKIWKKGISWLLTIAMVIAMIPGSVLAAETTNAQTLPKGETLKQVENDGWTWVAGDESRVCGYDLGNHTHDPIGCLICEHENGHTVDKGCFGVDWDLCPGDEHEHTATKLGSEMDLSNWDTQAYTDKLDEYAEEATTTEGYQKAYDSAYNEMKEKLTDEYIDAKAVEYQAKYPTWSIDKIMTYFGSIIKSFAEKAAEPTAKGAGETAQLKYISGYCEEKMADTLFCAVYDENDVVCEHGDAHTNECYKGKLAPWCPGYEHTHVDAECFTVNWILKTDFNNNEIADESETYTVEYKDGSNVLHSESNLAYGADTPKIDNPALKTENQVVYEFTGWTPEVAGTVATPSVGNTITYTATWKESEDKNSDTIPDALQPCTVTVTGDNMTAEIKGSTGNPATVAAGSDVAVVIEVVGNYYITGLTLNGKDYTPYELSRAEVYFAAGYDEAYEIVVTTAPKIATEIAMNEGMSITYAPDLNDDEVFEAVEPKLLANSEEIEGDLFYKVNGWNAGTQTITVWYEGDDMYLPSEKTMEFVITKAPVEISVNRQVVQYGQDYEINVITEPYVDTIQFVVGIDVAEMYLEQNQMVGWKTGVNLIVPDALGDILNRIPGMKDGVNVSTLVDTLDSDLTKYLLEKAGIPATSLDALVNNLSALDEQLGGVKLTVNAPMPTNIGVYAVGAITADSNYETETAVGYIVVTPDGRKATLDWKIHDENGIVTLPVIKDGSYDLGAKVTDVAQGTEEDIANAQAVLKNLFLGVNVDGEIVFTEDQKELAIGAYTELAYVINWGNVVYYAEPIARAFVVTAEPVDIQFVDENGMINGDRLFTFDNAPHALDYVIYDDHATGTTALKYYGMQTNGEVYNSSTAPTHAGAYTAVVTYIEKNAEGELARAGMDAAVIVIAPAEASIDVTGKTVAYDGNGYTVAVEVESSVNGVTPDYTLISGGVSGDVSEAGLEDLTGNVNIDFPRWLDKALSQYDLYKNGVDKTSLSSFINAHRSELVSFISEKAADVNVEELDAYIDSLLTVLGKLPADVNLTFDDAKTYSAPGYYFFYGMVTDSDHMPTYDTGLLHIHGYDAVVTEPTCTEGGYTTYTCVCGDSYDADETAALGHSYDDGAVTDEPTCSEKGEKMFTCSVCGDTYTTEEGALGHTEVVDAAKAPTCTATGLTEGKHCSVCSTVLVAQTEVAALGHTEAVDAAKAPTCTATGLTEGKHCSVCSTVLVAQTEVAALGHTEAVDAAEAPTCTATGLTEGKHCSVCNEVLVAQTTVSAKSHAYGDWTSVDAQTHKHVCANDANHVETVAHTYDNASDTRCNDCGYVRTVGSSNSTSRPSSSGSGNTTTKVEKNDDGSTTTTTTDKKTGVVTETTKATDGTAVTVKTDAKGNVSEVSANVPTAAANAAAKNDEPVTLPIQVESTKNRDEATEINVNVPSKGATVEIPVDKVTSGTVVVIVNEDGTETIVPTTILTEDGVVVTLEEDATIKIIDNSKDFIDVPDDYTLADSIDFVAARGLFEGTSANTFTPHAKTTVAQTMTVLARLSGEDFYGPGSTAKGAEWAEECGLSDGIADVSKAITRQQMVVMMWKLAGMPSSDYNLNDFVDVQEIDAAAMVAMQWAVEHGILKGNLNNTIDPHGNATRAHVAAFAERYVNTIA